MEGKTAYGPAESGAIRNILGMFSKVPGSAGLATNYSLSARRRCLGAELMVGCVSESTRLGDGPRHASAKTLAQLEGIGQSEGP